MRCPALSELPPPPSEKAGWPWTEESEELLEMMHARNVFERKKGGLEIPDGNGPSSCAWPKISVVTPSYNQGQFIEETIRCILLQDYPNLEYIIVDGGSTDNTVEIIKRYQPWLKYWVSEPDEGMYDAINKGFARSTGEVLAWSPADDLYVAGALLTVGSIFREISEIEWLTSLHKVKIDEGGSLLSHYRVEGFSKDSFLKGYHNAGDSRSGQYCIAQQSTFWRRVLWERAGGNINKTYRFAGDYDLWARFYEITELYSVDEPLGVFRVHEHQTSQEQREQYLCEQEHSFRKTGGRRPGRIIEWLEGRMPRGVLRAMLAYIFPELRFKAMIVLRSEDTGKWYTEERAFF